VNRRQKAEAFLQYVLIIAQVRNCQTPSNVSVQPIQIIRDLAASSVVQRGAQTFLNDQDGSADLMGLGGVIASLQGAPRLGCRLQRPVQQHLDEFVRIS
jgi:hypothetical protein